MLTRDQFLAVTAGSFPKEEVEVPGLGGSVFVRAMSAGDRDRFEEVSAKTPHADFRARLVVATACDDQGKLLFTAADVPALSGLPASALDPVVTAAVRVNRMRPEDAEDLRKNSESGTA